MLAHRFGAVSNADIQQYRHEHPREIGECLKMLTHRGWLKSSGHGRWTRYQLGGATEADLFSSGSEHSDLNSEHYGELLAIAAPIREKGRASKSLVEKVILELCAEEFVMLRTLADLLNREPDSVRNHYVMPMVKRGVLEPRYPAHPNHPQQGYRTAGKEH